MYIKCTFDKNFNAYGTYTKTFVYHNTLAYVNLFRKFMLLWHVKLPQKLKDSLQAIWIRLNYNNY